MFVTGAKSWSSQCQSNADICSLANSHVLLGSRPQHTQCLCHQGWSQAALLMPLNSPNESLWFPDHSEHREKRMLDNLTPAVLSINIHLSFQYVCLYNYVVVYTQIFVISYSRYVSVTKCRFVPFGCTCAVHTEQYLAMPKPAYQNNHAWCLSYML